MIRMDIAGEISGFRAEKSIRERIRASMTGADEFRNFYYNHLFKVVLLLLPFEIAFVLFFMPYAIDFSGLPVEGAIVLSVFSILLAAAYVHILWRLCKPALTIREDKLRYSKIAFIRALEIDWDHIDGLTEEEVPYTRFTSVKVMKIIYRKMNDTVGQIVLNPNVLHKGNEAFSFLKKIIPPGPSVDAARRLADLKRSPLKNARYKNIELNDQGLNIESRTSKKTVTIPWDAIAALDSENDTGAGQTVIKIEYLKNSKKGRLVLRSTPSREFLDFLKLLMAHAKRNAIAPRLYKLLEPPIEAAKLDPVAAFLIISGFVLAIVGLIVLSFYPPTIASTWTYPLLLIPLCLFPLILTLRLQLGRNTAGARKRSYSIFAGLGFNFGTILAIAILFMLSPASYSWLAADANALCGRMDAAVAHYQKAETHLHENADFLFALGQFYYKKKDWEYAARYYIRAYEKDPTNWFAGPLEKIPDSLYNAGLTDEALAWCDKIMQSYAGRPDVMKVIQQKRKEIAGTLF